MRFLVEITRGRGMDERLLHHWIVEAGSKQAARDQALKGEVNLFEASLKATVHEM